MWQSHQTHRFFQHYRNVNSTILGRDLGLSITRSLSQILLYLNELTFLVPI